MFRCPKRSRQLNSFRRLGRIWLTTPCLRRIISFNWPFLFSIVCVWTAGSVGSTKWNPWFTARCRKRLSRCNLRYDRHSSVITFEPNLTWRKMIGISVAALRLRTIRKYYKPDLRSTMAYPLWASSNSSSSAPMSPLHPTQESFVGFYS